MTMKGLRCSRQHLLGKRIRMDARLPDGSIQRLIQNPLSLALLGGQFADGSRILVKPDGSGGLSFETA